MPLHNAQPVKFTDKRLSLMFSSNHVKALVVTLVKNFFELERKLHVKMRHSAVVENRFVNELHFEDFGDKDLYSMLLIFLKA